MAIIQQLMNDLKIRSQAKRDQNEKLNNNNIASYKKFESIYI